MPTSNATGPVMTPPMKPHKLAEVVEHKEASREVVRGLIREGVPTTMEVELEDREEVKEVAEEEAEDSKKRVNARVFEVSF